MTRQDWDSEVLHILSWITIESTPSPWYIGRLSPTSYVSHLLGLPSRNETTNFALYPKEIASHRSIPRYHCVVIQSLRSNSSMNFLIGIALYRSVWASPSMVLDDGQLNLISSTHHMKIHIFPTILSGQSMVTMSFTNITNNTNGAPHVTSLKLALTTSHHKEIIFLEWLVVHIMITSRSTQFHHDLNENGLPLSFYTHKQVLSYKNQTQLMKTHVSCTTTTHHNTQQCHKALSPILWIKFMFHHMFY